MKCITIILVLISACLPIYAASPPHYTLYYLNQTHNVSRILLNGKGKPIGKPVQMTHDWNVDYFSVSPDEKAILGIKIISENKDMDGNPQVDGDVVLWQSGKTSKWAKPIRLMVELRTILWTKSNRYVALVDGLDNCMVYVTVSTQPHLMVSRDGKSTTDSNLIAQGLDPDNSQLSPDERYVFTGANWESWGGTAMNDLKTGERITAFYDPLDSFTWIGKANKLAWVYRGELFIGELKYVDGKFDLHKDRMLMSGAPKNLFYVEKQGLYFTQHIAYHDVLYLSKDLKTYRKIGGIPPKSKPTAMQVLLKRNKYLQAKRAEFSPDRKFIVYVVKQKKRKEIRIIGMKGQSWFVDYGTAPHWKSPADYWNPYGVDPRSK